MMTKGFVSNNVMQHVASICISIWYHVPHTPKGELHNFFEYQHQRQWIPAPDDSKQPCSIKLQFTMLGRKLNVNTRPVDSGRKPVTGICLFLEGDVEEKLTIHIQHLSSLPAFLILSNELAYGSGIVNDKCQTLFTCMYCTC
ncbi:MACPF domain-containing protein At4g24290-like [Nymphaea colorata]|nr:MACPF domain-containing protein At4g24290-like [Nymphaea colorata]